MRHIKCSPLSPKVNLESSEFNVGYNISCPKTATNQYFKISNDITESRQTSSIDTLCFEVKSPIFKIEEKKGDFLSDEVSEISKKYFERMPLSSTSTTSTDKMKKVHPNEPKSNEESQVDPSTKYELNGNISHGNARVELCPLPSNSHQATRQEHAAHIASMPQLYSNSITTPTLSIQFSPLLSFSEERIPNSLIQSNQLFDIEAVPETVQSLPNQAEASVGGYDSKPNNISTMHTSSLTSNTMGTTNHVPNTNPELTYADNLLLNASQGIPTIFTPIKAEPRQIQNISEKKRKANNSCRSSRQPQKRFSVTNEVSGGDLFVSKRDGRVRLTTNLPRKVEAIDPVSGERAYVYASCSEASREMGVNRTRMSRTCRGGGGQIGNLIYQYVEMSCDTGENKHEHMIESEVIKSKMSVEADENEHEHIIGHIESETKDVLSL